MTDRNKHDCFKRLAEKRVNKMLDMIDLIGNLSNKSNYEYTKEEVDKIFSAIQLRLDKTKERFCEEKSKRKIFKLKEEFEDGRNDNE